MSPFQVFFYFDGLKVGDNGNDGASDIDYVAAIGARASIPGSGPFRGGSTVANSYADFSQSYETRTHALYRHSVCCFSIMPPF